MTVRFKGKDQILATYVAYPEAEYGAAPGGAYTSKRIGFVTEIVPAFDPDIAAIYVLRDGGNEGLPLALLSRRKNVRTRLTWLQPTMAGYTYIQTELFGGKNLWMQVKVRRTDTDEFYLWFTGLKLNVVTIRGSIGEYQTWIAEMIGKGLTIGDDKPAQQTEEGEMTTLPWMWKDTYMQYDAGSGLTLFPDLTDYEIRIDLGLKPNFVFNSDGSLDLTSLEEMETKVTARLTANVTSKEFLNYLLSLTDVDLKLMMPDNKYILLTDGKFRSVEPTIKPEDLIAQRLDFVAKTWSHGF